MRSRGKSVAAAAVLCALSVCAFGAANASALGMTAVKCVEVGEGNYNNSQCTTPKAENGSFETEQIFGPTNVEGTATTAKHTLGNTNEPVVVFRTTIVGIGFEVTCGKTSGTGKVTNIEVTEKVGEKEVTRMAGHATEAPVTYSECHAARQSDTTKICKVQGTAPASAVGEIKTNALTGTSIGTEHTVEVKPEVGETFTEFQILKKDAETSGCFSTVNLPVKVVGKLLATANTETHSHLTFTAATNGGGFKANGTPATFESTTTFWMEGKENEKVGGETF